MTVAFVGFGQPSSANQETKLAHDPCFSSFLKGRRHALERVELLKTWLTTTLMVELSLFSTKNIGTMFLSVTTMQNKHVGNSRVSRLGDMSLGYLTTNVSFVDSLVSKILFDSFPGPHLTKS